MALNSRTAHKIRLSADLVLYGGIVLCLLAVLALLLTARKGDSPPELVLRFLPAAGGLLVIITVTALLRAIASVIDRLPPKGQALSDLVNKLDIGLAQVRMAIEQLPGELQQGKPANVPAELPRLPAAPVGAANDAAHAHFTAKAMERMVFLLEEIREMSMLDDAGRAARRKAYLDRRKANYIVDAARHLSLREWGKAERLVAAMELDQPGDADVVRLRQELETGRGSIESQTFESVRAKVEDLMSISSWDQARAAAMHFVENYPSNEHGRALLERVDRERNIFQESTAHRLYEEVKDDIDRRHWRRALSGAHRLLKRFPNHRKVEKIQSQLGTIQENAEIEERQEHEAKIQELLRGKRFAEAIELAEDLLDRFPNSPQADSLDQLLPKMRELAVQQEVEA